MLDDLFGSDVSGPMVTFLHDGFEHIYPARSAIFLFIGAEKLSLLVVLVLIIFLTANFELWGHEVVPH